MGAARNWKRWNGIPSESQQDKYTFLELEHGCLHHRALECEYFLLTSLHYILEWWMCAAFRGIGTAKSNRVDVPWSDHYVLQLVIHPHGANESLWHASAHLAGRWRLPCTCPSATLHRKRTAMDSVPRDSKLWPFYQQPTLLCRQCYTSPAYRHQTSQRNLVLMPLNISALPSAKWFCVVSKRRI